MAANTNVDSTSPLGFGLLVAYCTAVLPYPDGNGGSFPRAITTVQPTLGLGTDPRTGTLLPDAASGRQLLVGAVLSRISTARGTLPDSEIPTTLAQYGVDVLDAIAADFTGAAAAEFVSQIDGQIQQDERIRNSTTTATIAGDVLVVPMALVDGAGPFRLVVTIDTLTQDLSVLSSPS